MRKIKYQAYDKESGQMHQIGQIDIDLEQTLGPGEVVKILHHVEMAKVNFDTPHDEKYNAAGNPCLRHFETLKQEIR